MENTWTVRDLPVLDALVQFLDDAGGYEYPQLSDITARTGLDISDVRKAALALESDGLIELRQSMGPADDWSVPRVSGQARRLVGQWPTAEQFADTLIRSLEEAAEAETDPARRSRLREVASAAGGIARSIVVDVAAAVIAKQAGG